MIVTWGCETPAAKLSSPFAQYRIIICMCDSWMNTAFWNTEWMYAQWMCLCILDSVEWLKCWIVSVENSITLFCASKSIAHRNEHTDYGIVQQICHQARGKKENSFQWYSFFQGKSVFHQRVCSKFAKNISYAAFFIAFELIISLEMLLIFFRSTKLMIFCWFKQLWLLLHLMNFYFLEKRAND